jgi:signal transduction histidine kinase/CheY-like chemotaxis protein
MDILNGHAGESERKMHSHSTPEIRPDDPLPLELEADAETPAHPSHTETLSGGGSRQGWVAIVQGFINPKLLQPPGEVLSFEEIYKRKLFSNLIIPGIIILLTFGLHHLFNHIFLEGCLDLIASLWLIFSVLWLRKMKKGLVIYRTNATLLGLLFLFLVAKGGTGGNKIFWVFSYPLITFYTLGIFEGLFWTTTIFTFILGILFAPLDSPWLHAYNSEFKIRFCVAFFLVSSLTYIYESVRAKSQSSLENERAKLEAEKRKLAATTRSEQAANRALKQSERRLKQAQSIARVGNFEYDIDADQLWGSEEALGILDLDPTRGQIAPAHLKDRAPDFYAFIAAYENLGERKCKFRLRSKGRSKQKLPQTVVYAWAELEYSPDGRPEKVVGVLQDISAQDQAEKEKKELEAKLVRSQKMEALGLLAGGVAHDLNNVLSGIVSYPDLLLMQLPGDSDLKKPLGVMRDSGQKAAAIVQDLLTLARRGVTSYDVLNLNELIDDYLQSPEWEKLKFHHPGVQIEVNLQSDLFNTKGSAIHLRKTLINLISNAAEALPEGGLVQVSTQNQYIDRQLKGYSDVNEGEYVVLRISDSGNGISNEDLSHIFEPFYTKKKMGRSGTGLGLAVVWGAVKDHNGYINVTSQIGKGTLMELYLPATRESIKRQDETIPLDAYHGNGEQILVVDDVEAQRDITAKMLTELGYLAVTVGSGEEAIAYLKTNGPDLVILDMIMDPGIDGLETYTQLRAFRPDQKTLIVSGFSETARVKQAQLLGAGAYVRKPFGIETIGVAVRRELDRSQVQ